MLDSLRRQKDNFIYTLIIIAVIAVMAFVGLGQMGDPKNSGGVAAYVNGEPIGQQEFARMLEGKVQQYRSLLGDKFDEKLLETFQVPSRTLDELVQYKLLAQNAKAMGFHVSDLELADSIRDTPYFQKNGVFDAELYAKIPNRGLEERRQRERLAVMRMQTYLTERVHLSPAQAQQMALMKETKVDLDFARIDFEDMASKEKVSEADVEKYSKSAPQAELQAYYDAHKREFTEPATVSLQQLRIGVAFQPTDAQKQAAKKKIDGIRAEIKDANFGELAKKHSDDEYAKKNGVTGPLSVQALEPTLQKAIASAKDQEIVGPIETPFGYYILKVLARKAEVVKPLDAVKRQVAEGAFKEKNKKAFADTKRAEWEKMLSSGQSLEGEFKKYKVDVKKTGPFALAQGYIPQVGEADVLLDAVFSLSPQHPTVKNLVFHQNQYYYLKLRTIEKPKADKLAKELETTEKSALQEMQNAMLTNYIDALRKKASVTNVVKFAAPGGPGQFQLN